MSPSLLLTLTALKLKMADIYCKTEEEGMALVSILEKSERWEMEDSISDEGRLHLEGEVGGQTWQGLARVISVHF